MSAGLWRVRNSCAWSTRRLGIEIPTTANTLSRINGDETNSFRDGRRLSRRWQDDDVGAIGSLLPGAWTARRAGDQRPGGGPGGHYEPAFAGVAGGRGRWRLFLLPLR